MTCTDCGGNTRVIDSRSAIRRRQCQKCGLRFTTEERVKGNGYSELANDSVVNELQRLLRERSEKGIKKYGVSLDRDDLDLEDWTQHALEEAMDLSLYLLRMKRDLRDAY